MTVLHSVIRRNKTGSLHCPCTSARPQAESRAAKQLNPPAKVRKRARTHTHTCKFMHVICFKIIFQKTHELQCGNILFVFILVPILDTILYDFYKSSLHLDCSDLLHPIRFLHNVTLPPSEQTLLLQLTRPHPFSFCQQTD